MRMRKLILRTAFALCTVFSAAVLIYSVMAERGVERSWDLPTPPVYVVGLYNDCLAVFPFGSETPSTVTEVRAGSLTAYDREKLEQGINVYNDEQLQQLLEDFDAF